MKYKLTLCMPLSRSIVVNLNEPFWISGSVINFVEESVDESYEKIIELLEVESLLVRVYLKGFIV